MSAPPYGIPYDELAMQRAEAEEAEAWFERQQMMAEDLHDRMKEDWA